MTWNQFVCLILPHNLVPYKKYEEGIGILKCTRCEGKLAYNEKIEGAFWMEGNDEKEMDDIYKFFEKPLRYDH